MVKGSSLRLDGVEEPTESEICTTDAVPNATDAVPNATSTNTAKREAGRIAGPVKKVRKVLPGTLSKSLDKRNTSLLSFGGDEDEG